MFSAFLGYNLMPILQKINSAVFEIMKQTHTNMEVQKKAFNRDKQGNIDGMVPGGVD